MSQEYVHFFRYSIAQLLSQKCTDLHSHQLMSVSFPSALPTRYISDLWILAHLIGKTCCLNVLLIFTSVVRLNPSDVQELCVSHFLHPLTHFS